jgi:hypothetical protein
MRGPRRPRLLGLTISLALMAVLAMALPAGASAARILYASGHDLDAGRLSAFGGNTAVAPGVEGFDGCSDSEWAAALARTDFDRLMVGEDAAHDCGTTLSAGTLSSIANYVRAGHAIIFTGAHGDEAAFMNAIFGFGTTAVSDTEGEGLTGTLQPSAAGTPFAGGPGTLKDPSGTVLLSGTPGTAIYTGPEGTWVFTTKFGSGQTIGAVTYLAWDFCDMNDCGNTPSVEDDWYRVLDRALQVKPSFTATVIGIRRNKKKGNATITLNVPHPGELTGSGKGVKVASAGGAVTSKSVGTGQVKLKVKAKGKKRRKLNQNGKVKLNLAITYSPTDGDGSSQSVKVKLKKRLKR